MSLVDGRLARTLEELHEYDFEIRHILGKRNVIADALSRSPVPDDQTSEADVGHSDYIPEGFEIAEVPGGGAHSLSVSLCFYTD